MTAPSSRKLEGRITVPGDKSIAHRLALLSAIATGRSRIQGFPNGADCASSVDVIRRLGVDAVLDNETLTVEGVGLHGLNPTTESLDAGNSGTTARLACGLLAGQRFDSRLTGDSSLSRRPFDRIERPLAKMGAHIESRDGKLPIILHGGQRLEGLDYELPVPSAQVKSAILLAGLYANGTTVVHEKTPSRNHTEIALADFGVRSDGESGAAAVTEGSRLTGRDFTIPGDFSSAAFFIGAAACLPGSELVVERVGLNPSRTALLDALGAMGADLDVALDDTAGAEPIGSVTVRGKELSGIELDPSRLPAMIDEIPILAVVATQASGTFTVAGASELRVKESDRLSAIMDGLNALGARVDTLPDGLIVHGGRPLRATALRTHGDHRMVMAWAMASLLVDGDCDIDHRDQVNISYPDFWNTLSRVTT